MISRWMEHIKMDGTSDNALRYVFFTYLSFYTERERNYLRIQNLKYISSTGGGGKFTS